MHKIIHPNFELDLSSYKISIVEENYWFSNRFFTKYSFPFTFEITDDLIEAFGDLLDDNAKFIETKFDVVYCFGDTMETAVFEIESQIDRKVTSTFRYGFDELPNFDKKLSELPLEEATITNVYGHAKTIIPLKWPAVNYNYPQIYTDKYDTKDATWESFQGKLNFYFNDEFIENLVVGGIPFNLNIIQPVPYMLHILKQGFLDAGFTLKGNILDNTYFKMMMLFSDIDYFEIAGNIQNAILNRDEYHILADNLACYHKEIQLEPSQKYQLTGEIFIYYNQEAFQNLDITDFPDNHWNTVPTFNIKYNNQIIGRSIDTNFQPLPVRKYVINNLFETNNDTNLSNQFLKFYNFSYFDNLNIENTIIFNIKVEKIVADSVSEILNYNKVNLKEVVPDVTFGKLITELKKWFNLEINPSGKDIYIDFLEENINYQNSVDLSNFEVLKPKKEYNKTDSFLLKFMKPSSEEILYESVFQEKSTIQNNELLVNDFTDIIEIDMLPLPQKSVEFVETAYSFDNAGNQKMYIVFYDGLQSGLNLTVDTSDVLIPNIHNLYHKKWLSFRLNSINYQWIFKMFTEEVLQIKKKIFAYGRFHVVKRLEKTQISEDLFEVQIESETLE